MRKYLFFILSLVFAFPVPAQLITISGLVTDSAGNGISQASVRVANSLISTSTDHNGHFEFQLARRGSYALVVKHLSFESKNQNIRNIGKDTLPVTIKLLEKPALLDMVNVSAVLKPETLVGKPEYSIYDFDFLDDNFILLTAQKSMEKAIIRITDASGKTLRQWPVPAAAGPAIRLHHDFEGNTELVCRDSIFKIEVFNQELLISTIRQKDFHHFIEAVSDSTNKQYYWTNRSDYYPAMDYYWLRQNDSLSNLLRQISNADLLSLYNMEYYYLPARARLEADRISKEYKTDVHVVAALMSGFTRSMFFEPLYAPLFVLNDTICIFNHHNDYLYHYDRENRLVDSVRISYHHPKNWREWKKKLFVDEEENKIYAYFSRDGHHYLKHINHSTGAEVMTYKLKNHSAANIRVRNGYVYYVYRPFESTQQKFLYREMIRN